MKWLTLVAGLAWCACGPAAADFSDDFADTKPNIRINYLSQNSGRNTYFVIIRVQKKAFQFKHFRLVVFQRGLLVSDFFFGNRITNGLAQFKSIKRLSSIFNIDARSKNSGSMLIFFS